MCFDYTNKGFIVSWDILNEQIIFDYSDAHWRRINLYLAHFLEHLKAMLQEVKDSTCLLWGLTENTEFYFEPRVI